MPFLNTENEVNPNLAGNSPQSPLKVAGPKAPVDPGPVDGAVSQPPEQAPAPPDPKEQQPADTFLPPAFSPGNAPPATPRAGGGSGSASTTTGGENAGGSGFDPNIAPWDVTKDQTVQGQMEKYLSKDNPLFDIARQSAMRQAGARGAQNSSLAAGMGELAVMNQAFQVASQDARTFARSAEFNAAMKNQFEAAEQQFVQNALLSEQNFQQAMLLQKEQIDGQLESISLSGKFQNWNAQNQFEREWQIFQNQQRSNYVGMMMENWTQWSSEQGGLTPEQYSAASAEFFKVHRGGLDLINSFASLPVKPTDDGYWGGAYWEWGKTGGG